MENAVTPEEKKLDETIGEVADATVPVAEAEEDQELIPESAEAEDVAEDMEEAGDEEEQNSGNPRIKSAYKGKVLKLSLAGALVDIGESLPALIHITQIKRPEDHQETNNINDLLEIGQEIDVWIKKIKDNRIELTMFKPFDLEWREIKKDMVVKGKVVRMEKFGVFVEIGAERPGLIHISEMAHSYVREPSDMLKDGDEVEAKVLEVNRRKKQIKLSMKALQDEPVQEEPKPRRSHHEASASDESSFPAPARQVSARAQQLKDGIASDKSAAAGAKRPKKTRKRAELNTEEITMTFTAAEATGEAEPTAMEIAIREAMEKAKSRNRSESKKKSGTSKEQEDILARTLNSKVG